MYTSGLKLQNSVILLKKGAQFVQVLRSQVETMRDRKLRVGPQDGMDDNQSIADSSSDFEIGDDDVCDIDSEWSDSAVASLGLKVKGSVRRRALLPDRDTDSGDEDNLPLSSLRKQNDYIQRVSVEAAQPLDATISSSQTATLLSENHQPMRSPVVVADVPDTVAPAPKEISASSSTPHPPASTVREDVGLSPRSSSAAPVEPGPSSVTSYISSECTDRGSKKMCGKRPCQPSTWKQNERKMLKNIGKAYIGFKGKEVLSKTIGPGCNEKCPKKCHQQFNGQREEIFSNYWISGDGNIQRQFIASFVLKTNTDCVLTKKPTSRRKSSLYYSFLESGQKKSVCRKFFLYTLGIKQNFVYRALDKLTSGGIVSVDGRGFHKNHVRINDETVKEIKERIKSFLAVRSHDCRQSTDRCTSRQT